MLILQSLLFVVSLFFVNTFNLLTVWYTAGLYLVFLGWWLLLDDGDIFVGFPWVIDLGVGLVFFMFILHYTTFLHQKATLNKTSREFTFVLLALLTFSSVMFFVYSPSSTTSNATFSRIWFFLLSWYGYYEFFFSPVVTDLNLLHDLYFSANSFEFFLINFFLLYGIITSVLATFLIKRIFSLMSYAQIMDQPILTHAADTYFIRNQDYLKQQATSTGSRVWTKRKDSNI